MFEIYGDLIPDKPMPEYTAYTNGSTDDFSIEKVREAMRKAREFEIRRKATDFIVKHPNGCQIEMFEAAEFVRFASGEETPDFISDFRRWFAIQLVRHGGVSEVLAMDREALKPTFEVPRIELPDPLDSFKLRVRLGG